MALRFTCSLLLFLMIAQLFQFAEPRSLRSRQDLKIGSEKKGMIYCYDTIEYFTEEVCYQGRCVLVNFTKSRPICVTIGYVP